MYPELLAFPRVEHAGTATTPAAVVGSVGFGVDIDRRRSVRRRTSARACDVSGQSRDRSQPDGSTDADVATRAIPRGFGCQRSRRNITHSSLADERPKLVIVALAAAHVIVENECISIEESAARRSRQHVYVGYVKSLFYRKVCKGEYLCLKIYN